MLHPSLRHLLANHLTGVVASEASAETFGTPGKSRRTSGRMLDLKAAEVYSSISAWTLRDLISLR